MNKLILEDSSIFEGVSFGAEHSIAGEVVFSTGMVGYPESLTDPSYAGQILILTYPLIGNYGVPEKSTWESHKIQVSGLIVSHYVNTPSHFQSKQTLSEWLRNENIPALEVKDTRLIAQKLRNKGTMLGKIIIGKDIALYDPNKENLVAKASTRRLLVELAQGDSLQDARRKTTVILIDCGAKQNISRCLAKRGTNVITVPWDFNIFNEEHLRRHLKGVRLKFDAIVISNGPGDPKMADKTINTIKTALQRKIPILGICLGHQLLTLAAGGDTYKLKFGHRSQNQPCALVGSSRCFITTQNHGFAVGKIPKNFKPWFVNANDNTNEGIIHDKMPWMSVQFHPEATPGPVDTEWVFDYFLNKIK